MAVDRIALLKDYLQEDPSDCFSRYALGLEFVKMSDLSRAWGCFEFLLKQAPEYLPAYYQSGQLLESMGRADEAIQVYKNGIALARVQGNEHARAELQGALFKLEEPED